MSLRSDRNLSFDELMRLNETQQIPQPEPMPMVQMTLEDWERLSVMIRRLENLIDGQALTEELMTETAEKYLSAMKKTAEETNSSVKKTLEKMDRMYTQQVGKANEMLSERIERRAIRDDVLWWVRFLAFSLPTLLVLALSVCYGWLPLG